MQNTSSKRGADGRFGASEGPKAKPIQVWLQPKTIELLDTLTKQWGVGRGKVIDQLLTRGPVPPESWQQVAEESKPTDSGPTKPKRRAKAKAKPAAAAAPKPEPTDVGPVDDWEEKEQELEPQLFQVGDRVRELMNSNGPIGEVVFHAVRYDRAKKCKRHQYDVVWGGLSTADGAMQEELVPAGPTDSGWNQKQAHEAASKARRDSFLRDRGIDPDDPSKNLDGTTRKKGKGLRALADEIEPQSQSEDEELQQALHVARLRLRATDEVLYRIALSIMNCDPIGAALTLFPLKAFLLESLESVGIKQRSRLTNAMWRELEELIPHGAAVFDQHVTPRLPDNDYRCLFWGAAIRLLATDSPPPTGDFPGLMEWCGFSGPRIQQARQIVNVWSAWERQQLDNNLQNFWNQNPDADRQLLGLPSHGAITRDEIKRAHRQAAKHSHPDKGGSDEAMAAINAAKERLLMTVAA